MTTLVTVEVSGREIYDALLTLTRQVTIMAEKVDNLCALSEDQEFRIRALEGRRWPLALLGALFPLLAIAISLFALLRS